MIKVTYSNRTRLSGNSLRKRALVISGLLYSKHVSKPGLDVAKTLSHLCKNNVKIILFPSFTFKSISRSLWQWLAREISLALKILKSQNKVDLVVIHQMVAVFACFLAKILRSKVIVYVGGSIYEGLHQRGLAKIMALASILLWKIQLRLADMIVVPAKQLIQLSKLTTYTHKVRIAPTRIINTPPLEEINYNKEMFRNENIVGYVGRFEIEKGIEALPKIICLTCKVKKSVNLKWILIGDGSLRQRIENEIKKLGLTNIVQFTGWVKNPETYMAKMRLLILPSNTEGVPNVILEAMACGTPVLATPVGGIPNIIKDGETGFLLKSNDPKHIAKRIIELLNKPDLLKKVSINAYNYVRENFSYEKTLEAWRKILSELQSNK